MRSTLLFLALLCAPAVARADDLLSYGSGGIRVGEKVVYPGAVFAAAYDPAQDLVWFRDGTTLEVIDLRDPTFAAVKIATKLPADGAFAITGASRAGYATGGDAWAISYPVLNVGKKVKVVAKQEGDFGENHEEDDAARSQIRKIKIVGKKWLKALAKRKRHDPPPNAVNATEHVEPQDPDACGEPDVCGNATTLGNSPYRIVVTSVEYGPGFAVMGCLLYDSAGKRWASPATSGKWNADEPETGPCDGYALSADGSQYAVGSSVCQPGEKMVGCMEVDDRVYLGWVTLPSD